MKSKIFMIIFIAVILPIAVIFVWGCADDEYQPITFIVKYSASEGGSVVGDTEQSVEIGGMTTEVEAVADTGYNFIGWNDGVKTALRADSGIGNDETFIALFAVSEGFISL